MNSTTTLWLYMTQAAVLYVAQQLVGTAKCRSFRYKLALLQEVLLDTLSSTMWRMCAGNWHCTHTAAMWNSMCHNKGYDYTRHSGSQSWLSCQGILLLGPCAFPPPMWLAYEARYRDSGGQIDPDCITTIRFFTLYVHMRESRLSTLLTCENHDCRLCSRARIMTVNFTHVQESRLSTLLTCKNHDCRLCSHARITTVDFAHVRESRLSHLSTCQIGTLYIYPLFVSFMWESLQGRDCWDSQDCPSYSHLCEQILECSPNAFYSGFCITALERNQLVTSYMVKKDIEIQPGFKPRSSEFQSDALTCTNWATGALALEQRICRWHCSILRLDLS